MIEQSIKLTRLVMVILSLIISPYAMSAATCVLNTSPGSINATLPLAPANITAGPDLPDGTIVYTGYYKPTFSPVVRCNLTTAGTYAYNKYLKILSAPTPLTGWSNSKFTNVYSSGLPGIGIVVWKGSIGITNNNYVVETYSFTAGQDSDLDSSFNFGLIKTGNITPGVINGSNFPTVVSAITNKSGVTNLPPDITLARISFSGAINVVSKTCTTPDVNVPMGSYNIADYFRKIGSTTPWNDASITLTHCPYFYGYYGTSKEVTITNTGGQTIPASIANTLLVSLQPTTDTIDAANGIMAIDSRVSGAASGVGIQLGWGESSQTPSLFNFAAEKSVTLPKDGTANIRIPLAARYIQTAASPTPGRANGKVTFLINYY